MIIGIDISMLVYQGSGVATYTYQLVKNLLHYFPEHEYRLFYSSFRRPSDFYYLEELSGLGGHIFDYRLPPRAIKYLWNRHSMIPVEWLMGKVDVFHFSDFLRSPLCRGTRGVTTIHDLTWKLFPEFHTPDIVNAHARKLARTVNSDDLILVDSKNTEADLLRFYPALQVDRIHVLPLPVDDRFGLIHDQTKITATLAKYQVPYPQKYLVYVGAIEPRKNLSTALRTFALLLQDPQFKDYQLLIAGRAGWKNEEFFTLVQSLKLTEKVHFTGFVEDEDVPVFYNIADCLVYLSLYEGFGLPPLEAARCGTPTLLYANSSLKELFPSDYPYTAKGKELESLKSILKAKKETVNKTGTKMQDWRTYCTNYLSLLK